MRYAMSLVRVQRGHSSLFNSLIIEELESPLRYDGHLSSLHANGGGARGEAGRSCEEHILETKRQKWDKAIGIPLDLLKNSKDR